jgi:AraC-like DNA-binding protein
VLLISPSLLTPGETALVVKALSTTTHAVAVLDEEPHDPLLLLRLGACGLKEAIDLRSCQGWNGLRRLLENGADPVAGRVAAIVLHHLDGAAPGTRRFFARMVYDARCVRTVCAMASRLGIVPSTLMSRFHRARLPSPKTLLAATRLVFAKALLEEPRFSLSAVANQLRYSSPQAFGRQVWRIPGMSAGEFRRSVTFAQMTDLYLDQLIVRHRTTYRTFDPFASFGGHHASTPNETQRSHLYQWGAAMKSRLGQTVITPGALETLTHGDVLSALYRHASGDWGDLCEEDRRSNEQGLRHGDRLLSAYHSTGGVKFWIITEWDRSVTTVLLPEEYWSPVAIRWAFPLG